MDLAIRLTCLLMTVICFVLSYTLMDELKPTTLTGRIVFRVVWVSLYVTGIVFMLSALWSGSL